MVGPSCSVDHNMSRLRKISMNLNFEMRKEARANVVNMAVMLDNNNVLFLVV